jgi:hypothetical protein
MSEVKMGRPAKYTEAQVLEGIQRVKEIGNIPSGETVKKIMVAELNVPGGINAQSLDGEVHRLLAEEERQRREKLVAALPASSRSAAMAIGAQLGSLVLEHMAGEYDGLRVQAGKRIVDLTSDLSTQRAQIRTQLTQLGSKDGTIATLEQEKHELEQRLAGSVSEVSALKERIFHLEKQNDFGAEMVRLVTETLTQRGEGARGIC